jgi:hypothetical protein
MANRTVRCLSAALLLGLAVFQAGCFGPFRRHERREERRDDRYDHRDERRDDRYDHRDERRDDRRDRRY